jgi:hypothetical protein
MGLIDMMVALHWANQKFQKFNQCIMASSPSELQTPHGSNHFSSFLLFALHVSNVLECFHSWTRALKSLTKHLLMCFLCCFGDCTQLQSHVLSKFSIFSLWFYASKDHAHYIGLDKIYHEPMDTKCPMELHVLDHQVTLATLRLNVFELHIAYWDIHNRPKNDPIFRMIPHSHNKFPLQYVRSTSFIKILVSHI